MVETTSEKTPLQCKLDEFGEQLSKVGRVTVLVYDNPIHNIKRVGCTANMWNTMSNVSSEGRSSQRNVKNLFIV